MYDSELCLPGSLSIYLERRRSRQWTSAWCISASGLPVLRRRASRSHCYPLSQVLTSNSWSSSSQHHPVLAKGSRSAYLVVVVVVVDAGWIWPRRRQRLQRQWVSSRSHGERRLTRVWRKWWQSCCCCCCCCCQPFPCVCSSFCLLFVWGASFRWHVALTFGVTASVVSFCWAPNRSVLPPSRHCMCVSLGG